MQVKENQAREAQRMRTDNRGHELSLGEVIVQLDQFKNLMKCELKRFAEVCNERNLRYEDRFRALEKTFTAALAASKELTADAFAASEKAIDKAEDAQRESNAKSNEFRRQLNDQAQTFIPRLEAESRISSIAEKVDMNKNDVQKSIAELTKSRDQGTGQSTAEHFQQSKSQWIIGLVVGVLIAVVTMAIGILMHK
jgi:hypothetical protein